MDPHAVANLYAWSVQVAVLALAAGLVSRLLPIDAPAVRHAWWRTVLLTCLVLPLVQPWHAIAPAAVPTASELGVERVEATPVARSSGRGAGVPGLARSAMPPSWDAALAVALGTGAVLRLAWLAAGLLRLRRLRRAGTPADRTDELSELETRLRAAADIRYVEAIGQPVTFGLRRPVVLLPQSLRSHPERVQQAVLAHELWHVRRRDWPWVLAEEAVRAVLWFHPAIWWLVSRVQASREEVIDELTVLVTNSRRGYVEALLAFADQPALGPATPFVVRRHLIDRVLLISREAVMSSTRIVATSAAMAAVLAAAGWYGVQAFPLSEPQAAPAARQAPPRDPRPGQPRPPSAREVELQKLVAKGDANASLYLELAGLQEARAARDEAESTLNALKREHGSVPKTYYAIANHYTRHGLQDRALETVEEAAALDPSNPQGHQVVATYYEEIVRKASLSPVDRATYIANGIAAADRALAAQPDYVDAMVYKNILIRHQAEGETDAARKQALLAEADKLRTQAVALRKTQQSAPAAGGMPPPPPPPAPPGAGRDMPPPPPPPPPPGGKSPLRVGGNIKAPMKIKDVRPIYPESAKDAGVQGVVVLETLIDESGRVIWTRVLRSIPLLDEAATEAVRQWEFTPTLLNGEPVPVIMTTTVNFTLQ